MNGKRHKGLQNVLWASGKKVDLGRHLAQMGRGILIGLRESRLNVEGAQKDLFNLDVYEAARKERLDPSLIKFLEWGMELEDVVEVVPESLEESYKEMDQLLVSFLARSHKAKRRRNRPGTAMSMKSGAAHAAGPRKLAMTGS